MRPISWTSQLLLSTSIAQSIVDLSKFDWTVQSENGSINIPASFPSYVHLDLFHANVTSDPEYGLNEYNLRWVWKQNWTYSTNLTGINGMNGGQTYLVFQGLDTFTDIELCGQHVASTNNQFRQWYFDVSSILLNCSGQHALSINFGSSPNIAADIADEPGQETWPFGVEGVFEIPNRQFIRKEQNDFGWDWGPAYSPTGPWQTAYIVTIPQTQIYPRNVLVDLYRLGQRNNMIPDQSQPWVVNASIDFIGNLSSGATLAYTLKDIQNNTVRTGELENVNQTSSTITGEVQIPDGSVDLWWPVGMGSQSLYYLTVDINGQSNSTITSVTRRIGFRTIVLNELPVSAADQALGVAPGNNWHFEINGYPFYAKGSNFIPPDVFWTRVNDSLIRALFEDVVNGNQNMLRVWASGAYSPDFMYDAADEMGILLWSEFEFGDDLYPVDQAFLDNAYEEAVYQVRRVNHHPSLTYWAGGNELENLELYLVNQSAPDEYLRYKAEYEKLFLTTLFPAVFENSRSISYSPSSTSNGFVTLNFTDPPYFEERYENISYPGHIYGETDYYNYNSLVSFNNSAYPVGRFSNEFGYHSMPSAQTWEQYIPQDQLTFNSTYVLLRNKHYPSGSLNYTNFPNSTMGMVEMTLAAERWYPVPNKTDSLANFTAWCWTTQLFQAEYYGAQIQFYRRGSGLPQRTLGNLYWQLEDQWAAPTWAGIEVTGRWKVLHYHAKDLYQNVIVSPFYNTTTTAFEIWVTSDLWSSVNGSVDATWYFYNGTQISGPRGLDGMAVQVGALNSTQIFNSTLNTELKGLDFGDVVMKLSVNATGQLPNSNTTSTFTHENFFHASPLSQANLVDPGLALTMGDGSVTVTATRGVSVWTWLDYPAGVVVTFEENGFWLFKGESKTLTYNATKDTTGGKWLDGVTVQSLWNNTLAD